MTYSETIDNINNRIENIISDRLPQTYQHITIEPSDYNPTIDDTITVTITVKDQADSPVSGFTVPLQINGESITGLVTNSSGVVTYNYTCDEWGTVKFAVKSYTAFINVGGWKTYRDDSGYTVKYNEDIVVVEVHATGVNASTSWVELGATVLPASNPDLRPPTAIVITCSDIRVMLRALDNSQKIGIRASTNLSNISAYGIFMWRRK